MAKEFYSEWGLAQRSGGGSAVGEITQFGFNEPTYVDNNGNTWLQKGVISQDFASFPDARVTEGFNLDLSFGKYSNVTNIAYSPALNRWVATGYGSPGSKNVVYYSDDNLQTIQTTPTPGSISFSANGTVWDSRLNLFVSMGSTSGGTMSHMTSPNGLTWTNRGNAHNIFALDVSPNEIVGGTQSGSVLRSTDGINFTSHAILGASGNITNVKWVDRLNLWMCIGTSTGTAYTSPNGQTWTEVDLVGGSVSASPSSIVDAGTEILVYSGGTGVMWSTTDMITFVRETSSIIGEPGAAAYPGRVTYSPARGEFITEGSNSIAVSTDGRLFSTRAFISSVNDIKVVEDRLFARSGTAGAIYGSEEIFRFIGIKDVDSDPGIQTRSYMRIG